MFKYILETAGGINWMAVFALLTFMFIFITAAILVFTKKSTHLKHMSELPLANDHLQNEESNNS